MSATEAAAWWNGFRDGYILGAIMVALYAWETYKRHKGQAS